MAANSDDMSIFALSANQFSVRGKLTYGHNSFEQVIQTWHASFVHIRSTYEGLLSFSIETLTAAFTSSRRGACIASSSALFASDPPMAASAVAARTW
jgi:hypothetical protein